MQLKRLGLLLLSVAVVACGTSDDGDDTNVIPGNNHGDSLLPESIDCTSDMLCTIPAGDYTDMTWAATNTFLIEGNVFVDAGATLTIEPGVTIYGSGRTALIIKQGGKIMAEGTAAEPILFTSAKNDGERGRGDWGGLIVNGYAPVNCASAPGGTCAGEGNSGEYGGSDPADNSGVLRYVRVEFAGARITDEDEYNGIAFQGVGSNTVVDYVHLHKPSDDGIEFFGGSVNAKHIVVTGAGDDSVDWTFGWNGNLQYVLVQQHDDEADRGIEADNNNNNNDQEPRSLPTISHATFFGADAPDTQIGMLLRRGTGLHLHNAIIANFETCLDLADDATFNTTNISIANTMFSCATAFDEDPADPFVLSDFVMGQNNNSTDLAEMMDPGNKTRPDFRPMGAAMTGGVPPTGSFFEAGAFRGGVDPNGDWTTGWTTFPVN